MSLNELSNYIQFVANKVNVSTEITKKYTDILNNHSSYTITERANKVKALIPPLEQAISDLKEKAPSLDLQSPEEKKNALAFKNARIDKMTYQLESIKILTVEREITLEDMEKLVEINKKISSSGEEASKYGNLLVEYLKKNL